MIHNFGKIIVILGPTASGKTSFGISLAKKFKGEVICADSRSVYRYLDIATAKPIGKRCCSGVAKKLGCRKVKGINHYLIDIRGPKQIYTVAEFQKDAISAIELITRKGKQPFIVGGSPLYIYALTKGYQFSGKGDTRLRRELEGKELAELQAMVRRIKNLSINTSDYQNKRRLIRAIEIFGNSKLEIKNSSTCSPIPYSFLKIGINRPRIEVYRRIDLRTKAWFKEGLIEEVKALLRKGIGPKRITEFGLGYREVLRYLYGEIKTIKELEERVNYTQHAFVRRQLTWFNKDKEIIWCKKIDDAEKLINHFLSAD